MTPQQTFFSRGYLKWARVENKVLLYVKPPNQDHWIPYFKSDLSVPDWGMPGESKGYATAQKLLSLGYVYNQPKDY
jgi:hypothetical protein